MAYASAHTQVPHISATFVSIRSLPLAVPTLIKTKLDVGSTAARWFKRFLVLFAYQSMDRPASATVTPAATAVLPAPLTVGVGAGTVLVPALGATVKTGVFTFATAVETP